MFHGMQALLAQREAAHRAEFVRVALNADRLDACPPSAAIRSHLPHIATMFRGGNFDAPMLVHNSKNVPGTTVMASRKDAIRYQYVDTPNGGRVNIVTTVREALAAVHAFLKFQILDHKTGDSSTVRTR